jgi:hypothetical protein
MGKSVALKVNGSYTNNKNLKIKIIPNVIQVMPKKDKGIKVQWNPDRTPGFFINHSEASHKITNNTKAIIVNAFNCN